jgi:hypothetical protein
MTSFHVKHDFSPIVARDALLLLRWLREASEEELLLQARTRDLEIGRRQSISKVFTSLRDLGFVQRLPSPQREKLQLTPLGSQLADVAVRDELLFAELVHLRYWWLWTPELDGHKFAWAYQTVADLLWQEAPTSIDANRLVAAVLAAAEQRFGLKGISFSSSSILGILLWVRALRPSCLVAGEFRRRPICPPEALVVALEGIYAAMRRPLGIPLHLDSKTRERACRALLLEVAAFDEVLSRAEEVLGVVRHQGDGGEMVLIQEPFCLGLIPEGNHS